MYKYDVNDYLFVIMLLIECEKLQRIMISLYLIFLYYINIIHNGKFIN